MDSTKSSGSRKLLRLDRVCRQFGGVKALDELSFSVTAGETVGLIGPNGSGKSTAFDIISGLLPATSGDIMFDGTSITKLPAHQIARLGVARTFQSVRPFMNLTALENVVAGSMFGRVRLASQAEAEQHAVKMLAAVGIDAKASIPARELTITEQKWLEVARAIAGEPKLLLLDEFLAGFHPLEVTRALDLIRQLNAAGITIIMVEHIVKIVTAVCGRIIVLNAGRKLADGMPTQVVRQPNVRDVYLGMGNAGGN